MRFDVELLLLALAPVFLLCIAWEAGTSPAPVRTTLSMRGATRCATRRSR